MKKFLISTIGKNPNIIKSLKFIAEHFKFDKYCYLITEDENVQATFKDIRNFLVNSQKVKEGENFNQLLFKNSEDFDKIYKELEESNLKKEIKESKEKGWKIYLDYTYGTKAISGQVLFYLVNNRLVDFVVYVSGRRENGIVVDNFDPKTFNLSRFYLEQDWKKVIGFIKSFRFDAALQLINQYNLEGDIRSILDFYINLLSGKFEEVSRKKIGGESGDFIKLDVEKIYEVKIKLKNYLKAKKENLAEDVLKFEMGYFYDLIKISAFKNEYPQVLALFCSFLDKFLTYHLFLKRQLLDRDFIFDFKQINVVFKNKTSSITGKKTPVSLSIKLDEFLRVNDKSKSGSDDFVKIREVIEKRNNSIFGHGFYFPDKKDAELALRLTEAFFKEMEIEKQGEYFLYYPTDVKISSITL